MVFHEEEGKLAPVQMVCYCNTLTSRNNLAAAYRAFGRHEEAARLERKLKRNKYKKDS